MTPALSPAPGLLRRWNQATDGFLGIIFCRALRDGPSPPLQHVPAVNYVAPSHVGMVCSLLVTSGLMMLGRFSVMARGVRQMF